MLNNHHPDPTLFAQIVIKLFIYCEYCNLIGWSAWRNISYTW